MWRSNLGRQQVQTLRRGELGFKIDVEPNDNSNNNNNSIQNNDSASNTTQEIMQ